MECTYSIYLHIEPILHATEFVHPTPYNRQQPHHGLDLSPRDALAEPAPRAQPNLEDLRVQRRALHGGLIHEYEPQHDDRILQPKRRGLR